MATITEGMHEGEFIGELAMGPGYHIDEVTLISGQNCVAGEVLGIIAASGKYAALDQSDETAAGILVGAVDASSGDVTNARVLRRGPAMVNSNDLTWPSGATPADKAAGEADLLALGIKVA
mgnify:CR=1 FL=1